MNVPPEEELVDALDEQGNVVGTVTRGEMRAANLWHRSVFVVVVNDSDEILVHRRASWKDKWPDLWDIAVGGVVTAGEAWELAAARELAEEIGVSVELGYLGEDVYADEDVREVAPSPSPTVRSPRPRGSRWRSCATGWPATRSAPTASPWSCPASTRRRPS
jgi:isopentenyldiphosphate isomerase